MYHFTRTLTMLSVNYDTLLDHCCAEKITPSLPDHGCAEEITARKRGNGKLSLSCSDLWVRVKSETTSSVLNCLLHNQMTLGTWCALESTFCCCPKVNKGPTPIYLSLILPLYHPSKQKILLTIMT